MVICNNMPSYSDFFGRGGTQNQKKTPVRLEILGVRDISLRTWEHLHHKNQKKFTNKAPFFFIGKGKSAQVQILVMFSENFQEHIQKFLVGNSVGAQRTKLKIGRKAGQQHTQPARCGILGFGFSLFPTLLIFSTSSHKFSPKWPATFHHTQSKRVTFKRENHHWKEWLPLRENAQSTYEDDIDSGGPSKFYQS